MELLFTPTDQTTGAPAITRPIGIVKIVREARELPGRRFEVENMTTGQRDLARSDELRAFPTL